MEIKRPHIALVGFMGAGKTSVGRVLAERLGLQFIDLDEEIVKLTGKSISDIFRDSGEVAFRAKERAALREVFNQSGPLVLATGGGTFIDGIMRDLILKHARTIYLQTDMSKVMERVGSGRERENRPLLRGPAPEKAVELLLTEREKHYQRAEFCVNTSDHTIEEVVLHILQALGLHRSPRHQIRAVERGRLHTTAQNRPPFPPIEKTADGYEVKIDSSNGAYPVEFRNNAGNWIAEKIADLTQTNRVVVITDSTVASLHAQALLRDLRNNQMNVDLLQFDAGEASKSLGTAARLFDQLLEMELTRSDTLIALGGGVVGDLTGFVASTFLRGIDFIQVPTTTLAAVDSSVGGKTAVNTPRGKNLVGTFHAPKGVFVAVSHLATQEPQQHAGGLVEALKMAATLDKSLFLQIVDHATALLTYQPDDLLSVLAHSIQLKAHIVNQDEHERGIRAVLNYGHTIGHAIEKGEEYSILHGEAVALGMVAESQWAEECGYSSRVSEIIQDALTRLGMPIVWSKRRLDINSLKLDKKRIGSKASVAVPIVSNLGQFEMKTVPLSSLSEFLKGRISP